jgi:hypothetical protein
MNVGAEHDNKRAAPRLRSFKGAHLVLPNHASTFRCTVRNISETGLCVELPSTLAVPNRVLLKMDDGRSDRWCNVAWRTETRLGLQYAPRDPDPRL